MVEQGTHEELYAVPDSVYRSLVQLQEQATDRRGALSATATADLEAEEASDDDDLCVGAADDADAAAATAPSDPGAPPRASAKRVLLHKLRRGGSSSVERRGSGRPDAAKGVAADGAQGKVLPSKVKGGAQAGKEQLSSKKDAPGDGDEDEGDEELVCLRVVFRACTLCLRRVHILHRGTVCERCPGWPQLGMSDHTSICWCDAAFCRHPHGSLLCSSTVSLGMFLGFCRSLCTCMVLPLPL